MNQVEEIKSQEINIEMNDKIQEIDSKFSENSTNYSQSSSGYHTKKQMPKIPPKMIIVVSILTIAGAILFLIGAIDELTNEVTQTSRNYSFVILGTILLIPGVFYGYRMGHAYITKDEEEMQMIINDFPLDAY